ncbi:MAG TPA: hypothetical protein PLV92_22245, partial [Pirellulaceae bacterium]|nr:hypothetical protein [Pirellulaceae bacterium]
MAIRYTFGKPDSIRGYIDGRETTGDWDMGGKTTRPPIVDVDDLSVGSGNGGGAGNRFDGAIDELTVYRGDVPAEELLRRFQFVPPPPALALEQVPADRVIVQICEEGLPPRYGWPAIAPPATETFDEELMAVVGLPQKYVDTGVRGDRANPLLLRYAARVTLPEGRHRLLLRARGLTRLVVDGKSILSLAAPKGDEGGHSKVPSEDEYLNLGPDFRFAPPGTQEAWAEFEAPGREQLFICETLVGGAARSSKVRPELGETVVAVSLAGSQRWELLGPGDRRMAYDDATWPEFAANRAKRIEQMDAAARAARRAEHSAYWNRRRDAAQKWLAATPETAVPELPAGYPAQNPIDNFIAARLVAAQQVQRTAAAGEVDFYRDIQPILEAKCWDCHRGGKSKGGLRLDSLASARKGGESGLAAVEPGRIAASELLIRVRSTDPDTVMPPRGVRLTPQEIQLIERWIAGGATWPDYRVEKFELTPLCDDHTFVRRVALDTVGVPPSLDELRELFA